MKNLYLLIFVLLLSCKEKEDPKPESKTAPLIIEFSASKTSPIYSTIFISPEKENSEYFYTDTSTTVTYTVNKPNYKGGRTIQFGGTTRLASNGDLVSGGTFTLKATYNGKVITDQTINSSIHTISATVVLPFIE
jgi:hypothetical protein